MQAEFLFGLALGLQAPWEVKRLKFDGEPKRLEIELDFKEGARWDCPHCAKPGCAVHDTKWREWRHLNFFEHATLLRARVPRAECPACGVKQVEVPWGKPGSGFTLLFEAFVLMLVRSGLPVSKIAEKLRVNDNRIWRVVFRYVEEGLARENLSGVRYIGVDETSLRKGHAYITVVVNLEGERKRVLFAVEGKGHEALEAFAGHLRAHKGDPQQIQEVCQDLSAAFAKGVREQFGNAKLTFDEFHVIALASKALDQTRREERKDVPELAGKRYAVLKNSENWTEMDRARMDEVLKYGKKTGRGWALKTALQEVYDAKTREQGERWLQGWCAWAQRSRLKPFVRLAKTVRRHWDGILRWFDSRLTNAAVEAINGLIQATKRVARGFRNTAYLIAMIYLKQGDLELNCPH
jgi:transposase